jgi:tRNA-modifying protein YgfZ
MIPEKTTEAFSAAYSDARPITDRPEMPPFFFDLSPRIKLRITGADRLRLINGQVTNDVRKSDPGTALEACVLNAKGRFDAHLFLFATDDGIWIDTAEELGELAARLERYVIADDVAIEDITAEFALFHVVAETSPQIPEAKFCVKSRRLNEQGWDIWSAAVDSNKLREALSLRTEFLDPGALEVRRIENGVGRWGRELTPGIIPPEANLQERAIDYEKGCYIGQEVISRLKMSGQMRQRLCGVIAADELEAGMELRASDKVAGKITSAAFSERLGTHIGLAMIKRSFTEPGTELIGSSGERSTQVRVTALPFVA